MAEYQRAATQHAGVRTHEIDEGLRSHMNAVYSYLAGGLALAGILAFVVASTPAVAQAIYGTGLRWVVAFAPLAFLLLISFRLNKMSTRGVQMAYWAFTALMGVSLSYVFLLYGMGSIAKAFLITSVSFLALSLYGYTTKKDLSGWGSFLIMGVVGLILASIVNIFMASSALDFAISVMGVLIFAGLTAYDTQRIKTEYLYFANAGPEGAAWLGKGAVLGALGLFINFVNLFQFILAFVGGGGE